MRSELNGPDLDHYIAGNYGEDSVAWEDEDREPPDLPPDPEPPPPAPFILTYVYACGCRDTRQVWPGAPDYFPREGPCPDCWLRHSLHVAWVEGEAYP